MAVPLRVLVLEDRPADAELMAAELRKAGYAPQWQRVDTEHDYVAGLAGPLDIILADHALPQYDSVRALERLQERGLDVPFLIVSGTIGEELAVGLMKKGAADYVWKDRLARLGQAVSHALEQKALREKARQAIQKTRDNEAWFQALTDKILDGILVVDGSGTILYSSPSTGRILGHAPETMRGSNAFALVHPEDLAALQQRFAVLAENAGNTATATFRGRHANGSWRWLEFVGVNRIGELPINGVLLTYRDVSERIATEQQLGLQGQALEAAANSIVITDRQGAIAWVNQAFTRMTGYTSDEVLGRNPRLLKSGEQDASYYEGLWRTILAGKVWHGELTNRRKDGTLYTDEMTITPVCTNGTGVTHFVAIKQDVSERKWMEESLREREDNIRLLLNSTAEAIYGLDMHGCCTFCNPACLRILGYAGAQDLLGRNMHDALHHSYADGSPYPVERCPIFQAFQESKPTHVEDEVLWRANRTSFPAEYWSYPIRHGDNVVGAVVTFLDITERKQAEEALRASEERFRRITTNMLDLVVQVNTEGIYEYVTPSTLSILGYRAEEMIGHSLFPLVHPEDLERALTAFRTVMETGAPQGGDFRFQQANGQYFWMEAVGSRIVDEQGQVCGAVIASRDITERKRADEQIRALNAELEQRVRDRTVQLEAANKELEAFAYSVSHDLRAPLRGIDGFSQALLEDYADKLDPEGQACLRRVRAASQRMGRLIDDILQLSRLTRSAMTRAQVDLSAMAARVVAELQTAEPARHVDIGLAPGLAADGDARLLEVVLTNLLGNAWKFTSKTPGARIEFGVTDHEGQRAFFVRDNGAGFDMAYAGRLFGAFQRLHSDAEFPGTGIGLATVQRIVHRHGGQIWAQSAVGRGATFFFTLS
jgi:PAS domain S-box-containing protein